MSRANSYQPVSLPQSAPEPSQRSNKVNIQGYYKQSCPKYPTSFLPDADAQAADQADTQRVRLLADDSLEASNLAAQVGVLARYDGKPQDSWPSQTLTLNALVATLSTICHTSLTCTVGSLLAQAKWNRFSSRRETDYFPLKDYALLDEASRGSWGSARLLYRFKGSHVACVGAALSILSQVFGLLSQQLVTLRTYQVELRSATATGQVARTMWLEYEGPVAEYFVGCTVQASEIAICIGMIAPSIDIPQVQCPTGNCTWPIIPTIGICGTCLNVTDDVRFSRVNESACVLEIPNGMKLERDECDLPYYFNTDDYFTVGPGSGRVFSSSSSSSSSNIPRRNASNVITEFGGIGVPMGRLITELNMTINDSIAAECALWYCLQAREIRVEMGELRDRIKETWSEVLVHYEPDFSGNATFTNIPPSMGTATGDQYTMDRELLYGMREFGGVLISKGDFTYSFFSSFDDIHGWMDRITSSMTNAVRINGTDPPTDARYWGTAITSQVVIVVRWEWIVYPAVMVVASMVYLVIEIVRTAKIGVRPWKDDPLLPVCMEVDEIIRQQAGKGLDEPDGIEKRVGEYEVRLRRDDGFSMGFIRRSSCSG
ncbi:uncharacterized protein NECHADRAFT_81843 [Fusarium vanettenii 77-13-4]|uniref:Uncharacterized protein n=1 Tax=Fusarium vanettenii (strain ATCC MYA-4622 / CBS 123669 / FGSC 9596 / NRRL 45880 / 77-13-4) TaxID=660122 RepID=C7Z9R3_FUSV7|nr:uncharacterized protein NECHADRAFT_81843 [Fusarium vanettenii 77-13-4]EEU39547.1 hypothetical protein NECHADRAFT_81843 [Fusarium vanettenii 77-13-4]